MAISKKGLRTLKIGEKEFLWRFAEHVLVLSELHAHAPLRVYMGWYDSWLYIQQKENIPPPFKPASITPKFVRAAIEFALDHGWPAQKMDIEFKDDTFRILQSK